MALRCSRCGLTSPTEASYCYFDGSALQGAVLHGLADPTQAPFAEPFYFPSGEVCRNFDQLALTCQHRWQETWTLLRVGGFQAFLARVGRADLLRAATEAAAAPDPDHGVDQFVARLPARNLAAPRLRVSPAEMQLGTLEAGPSPEFNLRLTNEGHRLIAGHVTPDCAWLEVEGAPPGQPRLTQFVQEQTVRVRVVAARLPAGQKPRTGKLLIATNAGDAEVAVSCMVPILPFPKGVLRGCTTPREVAVKAKQFPDEAAELFYRGQVQAWYRSNGWVYPVEGEPASGKAAVQQFFEALGLTKPPRVILDTPAVAFQARPGKTLQQTIQLHTDDKRPIFAFGRSLSPWLTVVGSVSQGSHASIAIEIQVPAGPAARLETTLEVRTNGNQRFQVPIVLLIDHALAAPPAPPASPFAVDRQPVAARTAAPRASYGCLLRAVVAVSLLGVLMVAAVAGILILLLRPDLLHRSPLVPYAAAVAPETCAVLACDFDALDRAPGFETDGRKLRAGIVERFADLDLQADDLQPSGLFVAMASGVPPLTVWTFASPVQVGKATSGHFDAPPGKGPRVYVDQLDASAAWAVDKHGRLVGGTPAAVRAALERERTGARSPAYTALARAATGVTAGAVVWIAGDFSAGDQALRGVFGEGAPPRLDRFRLELTVTAAPAFTLHGQGAFPSSEEAAKFRETVRALPNDAIPLLPAALDLHSQVAGAAAWEPRDTDMRGEVKLEAPPVHAVLDAAIDALDQANRRTATAIADRVEKQCAPGVRAIREGDYAGAINVFEQVSGWFPKSAAARARLQDARQALAEQKAYAADLQAARDALAADKIAAARGALDRMKQSRFADGQLGALEQEWGERERVGRARVAFDEGRKLVGRGDLTKALAAYESGCSLNAADRLAAGELRAVKRIQAVAGSIKRAEARLADQQMEAARQEVMKGLDHLREDASAPAWQIGSFKAHRARLLKSGLGVVHAVYDAAKSTGDEALHKAGRLLLKEQFAQAGEAFKDAQTQFDRAQAILDDLGKVEGKGACFTTESLAIQKGVVAIRQAGQTVAGKVLLANGRKKLADATAAVQGARADPAVIPAALATLDEALQALRDAEALNAGNAKEAIDAAAALRRRVGGILHPVALDPSGNLKNTDWSFLKTEWAMKAGPDGPCWLQAVGTERASLLSIGSDWPREFEVAMDFALVDADGKINNTLWAYYADPLTLRLQNAGGASLFQFALGNDEKIKGQRFVRVRVDKGEHSLPKALPADQPIHLLLRCKKREADGRRILTATLDDREIAAVALDDDVQGLRLQVANPEREALGRRWFVAIFRLDATWIGAAKEKTKDP